VKGKGGLKRKEGRTFRGAAFSKNLADLAVQRGRRTWRNPSSSQERRRQVVRRLVRVNIMGCGHTAEKQALSRSFGRIGDQRTIASVVGPVPSWRAPRASADMARSLVETRIRYNFYQTFSSAG